MVKFACMTMVAQKICHILYLLFLIMSDKNRQSLEFDGSTDLNSDAIPIILQHCIGVAIFIGAHFLVHKRSCAAQYFVPWFFTIGLLLELPLKPVLPENVIFVMSALLML